MFEANIKAIHMCHVTKLPKKVIIFLNKSDIYLINGMFLCTIYYHKTYLAQVFFNLIKEKDNIAF